jgi:hypothetical protein
MNIIDKESTCGAYKVFGILGDIANDPFLRRDNRRLALWVGYDSLGQLLRPVKGHSERNT